MIFAIYIGWIINAICVSGFDLEVQANENLNIDESRTRALEWLLSVQNDNGGWGSKDYPETHRILTSIILSNETFRNEHNLKYQKAFERLKAELSERIISLSAGQLALYANALMANCYNPQNFNGVNIINKMIEKKKISEYEIGLVSLSVCLAKEKYDTILMDSDFLEKLNSYFIDSRAMITLALICIKEKYNENEMDEYIQEQLESFKALQKPEGNFGNIYTSALIVQALLAAKENDGWSYVNGIDYIFSQQKQDGSFSDLLATYFVLPVLSGRSFLDIGNIGCQNLKVPDYSESIASKQVVITENPRVSEISDITENSLAQPPEDNLINVVFSLWSEKNGTSTCFNFHSKKFSVPENSTFLDVMKIAQKEDDRYSFKAKIYSFGTFIEEIDGIRNDGINQYYWGLYKINESGDLILTSYGVDREQPKNDDHYIFKYCIGICSLC